MTMLPRDVSRLLLVLAHESSGRPGHFVDETKISKRLELSWDAIWESANQAQADGLVEIATHAVGSRTYFGLRLTQLGQQYVIQLDALGSLQNRHGAESTHVTANTTTHLKKLTGTQFGRFQQALLSAFHYESLQQMVQVHLDQRLDIIASKSNLENVTFELLDWAQRSGNLQALLDGAIAAVPDNADLQDLAAYFAGIDK